LIPGWRLYGDGNRLVRARLSTLLWICWNHNIYEVRADLAGHIFRLHYHHARVVHASDDLRIHRLPVVDAQGKLTGILSLNDLALEARREAKGGGREIKSVDVAETLGVLCDHRAT
jgi:hypothetical protein